MDELARQHRVVRAVNETFLVRVRRPDGKETLLRVPNEHLQRVLDLAAGEFGDKSILQGPTKEVPARR